MIVVRSLPSSRTSRAWISTSPPSRASATRSMTESRSSGCTVSIQPVPSSCSARSPTSEQNASLTCASRMPCSESSVGIGDRSVSVENRRSWASAVARSARSCSLEVAMTRRVHIRPPGDGVAVTQASSEAPLAVRTGSVMREARSRRSSSLS